jgi:hypothetical protein
MKLRILLGLVVVTVFTTQNLFADKIPLEDFIKLPQFAGLQISPDGKQLAVLAPVRDRVTPVTSSRIVRVPPATASSISSITASAEMRSNSPRRTPTVTPPSVSHETIGERGSLG